MTDSGQPTPTTAPSSDGPPPVGLLAAGIGRRFVAIAIDWLVAILIARVLFPAAGYLTDEGSFAILATFAGQIIILTWLTGSSFGQVIMGLRVVRTDGSRLSLWRVTLRTLLICLVIPAVVFDSTGRGLHDRAVGSIVIRR